MARARRTLPRMILARRWPASQAARLRGTQRVEPKLPVDVLGLYVYLPVAP